MRHVSGTWRTRGRAVLVLAALIVALQLTGLTSSPISTDPIVLRGTVLTPGGVLRHGYLAIANGRILSVSEQPPEIPGAIAVNTAGIILPGFVDAHNHVVWNVLPRWTPSRLFTNQPDWADDTEFRLVRGAFDRLAATHVCDMNAWGEMRALVGGTTSILATQPVAAFTDSCAIWTSTAASTARQS